MHGWVGRQLMFALLKSVILPAIVYGLCACRCMSLTLNQEIDNSALVCILCLYRISMSMKDGKLGPSWISLERVLDLESSRACSHEEKSEL